MIDAYSNTAFAAQQGKWRSKLSPYALDILSFLKNAFCKMISVINLRTRIEIGLAFADYRRTLTGEELNWFTENIEFIQLIHDHLERLLNREMKKAEDGKEPQN